MSKPFDFYYINIKNIKNFERIKNVTDFLLQFDLSIDADVEYFVVVYEGLEILGCGAIAGNILKSIAVLPEYRGGKLAPILLTELISFAYELNRFDLFLFTRPTYKSMFANLGFNLLAEVKDKMVLMESSNSLQKYAESLKKHRHTGVKIGSIVMNANPFTLGHRYLAEYAANNCDWLHLFAVEEDASIFAFVDRFELIKQGLSHIKNITIHQGSQYIISKATFPNYFIKDEKTINECYAEIDLQLFKNYIAPSLGINMRFVGTEPFCPVTRLYNEKMQQILSDSDIDKTIDVVIIERLQYGGISVSATIVRKYLNEQNFEALKNLVPSTTYEYLKTYKPRIIN